MKLRATEKATQLALLMLLSSFCSSLIFPVLPLAVLAWGENAADGGLLVSAYGVASMASAPFLGRLSDRFGQRMVLVCCYIIGTLSYVGLASATNLAMALCWRISGGVAAGSVAVLQAAVLDAAGDDGSKGLSRLSALWALGYVLGPALAALLAVGGDLMVVSLIAASGTALQIVWARVAIAKFDRTSFGKIDDQKPAQFPKRRKLVQLTSLCVIAAVQAGLFAMAGYFCAQELNWGSRELAMLLVEGALSVTIFQFFILQRLIARLGVRLAGLSACVIGASAALSLSLLPVTALTIALSTPFLFVATSAAQTCLLSSYSEESGQHQRGSKMGDSAMVATLGQIAGPALFGIAMVAIGGQALFLGAAVGFLLVGMGYILAHAIQGSRTHEEIPS